MMVMVMIMVMVVVEVWKKPFRPGFIILMFKGILS